MSELTSDMVWFVNKEITLADGRKVTALVPQVYLVARNSDINSRGGVVSANQILGNVDTLENRGVIAGRDLTRIHSNQLQNEGSILGDTVDLSAKQNLINLGNIEAVKSLSLAAGKNLDIRSTLSSSESADGNVARTVLDRLATVKVTGAGGRLALHSNENLTIKAADIESQGSLSATAGNMLNVTTLTVSNKEYYNGDADNYYRLAQHSEVGSTLKGKDDVTLVAKKDVRIRQSNIGSEKGNVLIGSQQGDIQVEAGREEEQLASASKSVSRGRFGLSKTTEIRRHEHDIAQSVSSNIDGKTVNLIAGQGNVTVQGSNVVGENGLTVQAKNIDIKEAENKVYSEDFHSKKKSGVLGGGLGVTFGAQKQTLESDKTKFYAQGSQVGSLNGNTTLIAKNHYTQTASQVSAVNGDVNILAKNVDIKAADDKYETNTKQTFEQKGVTLAVTSPILSALQAVQGTVKSVERVGQSKNDRINAMAAANSAMDAYRAGQAVGQAGKAMQEAMENGSVDSVVGAQITYGQQKSESRTHTEGKTAAKSQVNAGGKVNIVATGAGKASNITIQGSDVSGKQGTFLEADNDINITAAEQTHKERSTNKSSGFNAGVAMKVSNGAVVGATLGGNYGKGYGNGDETTYVASHVGDSQSKTVIQAGGDANLIGSQVKGKRVEVNAQNLNIESLQDTATYKGKQMNGSGSVTVGYGVSAGGSFNKSKVNANHASVNEQAGIYAGDEGYDINVNHTDLKGGLIRFSTGTITHSDLENHSNYSGSSFGVSGSVAANFDTPFGKEGQAQSSKQAVDDDGNPIYRNDRGELTTEAKNAQGKDNAKQLATGWDSLDGNMSAGYGTDKSSQSSVTKSGINTAHIEIRDEKAQFEKTGKTAEEVLETIKTDITTETAAQHSGKLENQFNKEDVLKEINLQVQVTKDFIDNAQEIKDKVIDHYQEPKRKELRQAITDFHNAKEEDKAKYEDKINALIKDIYALEHIRTGLDLATGVVAGSPKVMSAKTLISVIDTETRRESLKNSLLAAPVEDINDGGKLYSNVGHNSGAFDGIKLGGVRMNYGIICGENNQRCNTDKNGNLELNSKGHIVYKGGDYKTLSEQLKNDKDSKKLFGATGGFQAIGGEMFGIKYKPGSFLDKLTETYAGQHDLVGGQLFFYDKEGNGKRDLTERQQFWIDRYSEAAVVGTTPTALPHALPIEVMNLLWGWK